METRALKTLDRRIEEETAKASALYARLEMAPPEHQWLIERQIDEVELTLLELSQKRDLLVSVDSPPTSPH
jgi:hypothetical protein